LIDKLLLQRFRFHCTRWFFLCQLYVCTHELLFLFIFVIFIK